MMMRSTKTRKRAPRVPMAQRLFLQQVDATIAKMRRRPLRTTATIIPAKTPVLISAKFRLFMTRRQTSETTKMMPRVAQERIKSRKLLKHPHEQHEQQQQHIEMSSLGLRLCAKNVLPRKLRGITNYRHAFCVDFLTIVLKIEL